MRKLLLPASLLIIGLPAIALAMAKKKSEAPVSKEIVRAIQFEKIEDRYIDLPDEHKGLQYFGDLNIGLEVRKRLQASNDFVILTEPRPQSDSRASISLAASAKPDDFHIPEAPSNPCLVNPQPQASMKLDIQINELTFRTGSRGERVFYGFERGHENIYNEGRDESHRNEFPLKSDGTNWFGHLFDDGGGMRSGLELGHEFNFDVLIVGAKLKHEEYAATMGVDIVSEDYKGARESEKILVKGNGFYFDLSAHLIYEGSEYSAAIMLARKIAMKKAFDNLAAKLAVQIEAKLKNSPLLAHFALKCAGESLIDVGAGHRVGLGQLFYDRTQYDRGETPAVVSVVKTYINSAAILVVGGKQIAIGDTLVSLKPGESVPRLQARTGFAASAATPKESELSAGRIDQALPKELEKYKESSLTRLWRGVKELVTLPYRIWRYYQYDKKFEGGEFWAVDAKRAAALAKNSWALKAIGADQYFTSCAATNKQGCLGQRGVIVAVIDSGVDYNHRELRRNIFWDGIADTPGFDFISGDPRPFDDQTHGTEVASVITGGGANIIGVAPNVTLMPLKVFTPYGQTTSNAIYSAFDYALKQGAKIIVTGWASAKASKAIEMGLEAAERAGVLVVAAAGDDGVDLDRQPRYPAAYQKRFPNTLLVVGAFNKNGDVITRGTFKSNWGSPVSLVAPGGGDGLQTAQPRDRYGKRAHTGIAAGFSAGVAALMLGECPGAHSKDLIEGLQGQAQNHDFNRLSALKSIDYISRICK